MCVSVCVNVCVCGERERDGAVFVAADRQGVDWGEARMETITGMPVHSAREED